ncbi:MAG: hypothetical protein ACFFG0_21815 [Candidatus Thorarchaeota archaeon]
MKLDIVLPHENFRGLSYGEWATEWTRWLFSDDPTYNGEDILFLRGNVNYGPIGGEEGGPQYLDPKAIYYRTGKNREIIFENTSICIGIFTSTFSLGEIYEGRKISSIPYLRYIANKDTDGGSIWATITKKGEKTTRIVRDLIKYRFESPLFLLSVPKNSKLRKKMDYPPDPGSYYTITVGYFVILKWLPPGIYRFRFGGNNASAYHTDSVYDVEVVKKIKDKVVDKSGIIR